jgi:hypothetical protein
MALDYAFLGIILVQQNDAGCGRFFQHALGFFLANT